MRSLGQQGKPGTGGNPPQLKILVVEDDELSQRMLGLMLRTSTHIISFASNGLEAIEVCAKDEMDCIFMDIQMPVMDGMEATRQIRKAEKPGHRTMIIGMSAIVDSAYGECLKAGMDGIIPKPINIKKFQMMIAECAEKKSSGAAPQDLPVQVLDFSGAIERLGGDAEGYQALLDEFSRSLPERQSKFASAFLARDLSLLASLAHNLKGLSANFGAFALSQRSMELERSALAGNLEESEGRLVAIRLCVDDLQKAVEEYLNHGTKREA